MGSFGDTKGDFSYLLMKSMEEILGIKLKRRKPNIRLARRSILGWILLFIGGIGSLTFKILQYMKIGSFDTVILSITILGLISLIYKSMKWHFTRKLIKRYIHPLAVVPSLISVIILVFLGIIAFDTMFLIGLAPLCWFEFVCVSNVNWKFIKLSFKKFWLIDETKSIEYVVNTSAEVFLSAYFLIGFMAFVFGGNLLVTLWMILQILHLL